MHVAIPIASHSVEGKMESHMDIQGTSWEPKTSALALEQLRIQAQPF